MLFGLKKPLTPPFNPDGEDYRKQLGIAPIMPHASPQAERDEPPAPALADTGLRPDVGISPHPQREMVDSSMGIAPPRPSMTPIETAREEYEDLATRPIGKASKWKDVLQFLAVVGNNMLNPNNQVQYQGYNRMKRNKELARTGQKISAMEMLQKGRDAEVQRQLDRQYKQAQTTNIYEDNTRLAQRDKEQAEQAWQKIFDTQDFNDWKMRHGDEKLSDEANFRKWKMERGDQDANDREAWRRFQREKAEADRELRRQGYDTQIKVAQIGAGSRESVARIAQEGAGQRKQADLIERAKERAAKDARYRREMRLKIDAAEKAGQLTPEQAAKARADFPE